jgi:steroid 5-alpha reductase family enzyme
MNYYFVLAFFIFVYMSLWFVIALIKKRNDVADIAWGLGFVFISWLALYLSGFTLKAFLVDLLVTVWGIRLALHIYKRNSKKPEDARYAAWRAEWKNFYLRSYLQIFILQGVLLFLISIPVLFINHASQSSIELVTILGLLIWSFGFYFESTADSQLSQFISNPENKGKIMDQGLWKCSRHPNYFGEVSQWWGIFIVALSIPGGYLTIIGPLTITISILFISGIPLLEKKRLGQPAFEEYKKHTSVFIPLPPKK